MATSAPSRAAATAWFAPLPPEETTRSEPDTVSPPAGRRRVRTVRSTLIDPTTATRPLTPLPRRRCVPARRPPAPRTGCGPARGHRRGAARRGRSAQVGDGHAGGQRAVQLDVHRRPPHGHHARVDDVGDRARVVHRGRGEALDLGVRGLEELQDVQHDLGRPGADRGDRVEHVRGGQRLVGQVQPDHHHRPRLVEDDVRGLRVDGDVELGDRGAGCRCGSRRPSAPPRAPARPAAAPCARPARCWSARPSAPG